MKAGDEEPSSLCLPAIRSAASSFALLIEIGISIFKGRET